MGMIRDKCIFQNKFSLISVTYVVGTRWVCLIEIYVHSINECFYHIRVFTNF